MINTHLAIKDKKIQKNTTTMITISYTRKGESGKSITHYTQKNT